MRIQTGLPAPSRWTKAPAKYLFSPQNRPISNDDEIVTAFRDGVVTQRRNRRVDGFTNSLKEIGYHGVRAGDLVIHGMDGFAGAIGVSDSEGKLSPVAHCHLPGAGVDPRFYSYFLRTLSGAGRIASLARGIRERSTAFDSTTFGSLRLPVPPDAEQRRIADFLDAETARIDALITAKQRMIQELNAAHVAVKDHACLGGAVLDVTGIAPRYVGERDGWRSTWLRHLQCEVQTGPFGSQLHAEEYVEDGWPVVNPANLRDGTITRIAGMAVSEEKRAELRRHILELGDIVFGRRGEMGRAGIVGPEHVGWLCGTGSLRLRVSDDRLLPQYLKLQIESSAARSYFLLKSVGSTMDNLNADIVLSTPVVVPPVEGQVEIVERVRRSQVRSTSLTATLARQIELLRERRQALITAAVTGELAV